MLKNQLKSPKAKRRQILMYFKIFCFYRFFFFISIFFTSAFERFLEMYFEKCPIIPKRKRRHLEFKRNGNEFSKCFIFLIVGEYPGNVYHKQIWILFQKIPTNYKKSENSFPRILPNTCQQRSKCCIFSKLILHFYIQTFHKRTKVSNQHSFRIYLYLPFYIRKFFFLQT